MEIGDAFWGRRRGESERELHPSEERWLDSLKSSSKQELWTVAAMLHPLLVCSHLLLAAAIHRPTKLALVPSKQRQPSCADEIGIAPSLPLIISLPLSFVPQSLCDVRALPLLLVPSPPTSSSTSPPHVDLLLRGLLPSPARLLARARPLDR